MRAQRGREGFTLLELLVVAVLIAITLALTVPRVQDLFFNDPLSRSARVLVSAINEARGMALESGLGSVLLVDFSSGNVAIQLQPDSSGRDVSFTAEPVRVRVATPVTFGSVWTHTSGPLMSGTTPIWINRRGMIEPAIIELRDADRIMSIKVSPFQPEAEVFDHALPPPETLLAGSSMSS